MARDRRGRILLVENPDDVHFEFLSKYLSEPPLVLDFSRMGDGISVEYDARNSTPVILCGGQELPITSSVKSVWYRKARMDLILPNLGIEDPGEEKYAYSAMQHLTDSVIELIDPTAFWVSRRDAVIRAERKALQLSHARHVGLNVPETIFTSSADEARAFVRRAGIYVIKPLAKVAPPGFNQYTAYRSDDNLDFGGLEFCPHIFQRLVRPAFELRVAVVGNTTIAARVRNTNESQVLTTGVRDYRHAFDTGTFYAERFSLPQEISDRCIALVRSFGTVSGFIDLMVDEQGNYWFLEDNPNGQWAFTDDETTEYVACALARLLEAATCPW